MSAANDGSLIELRPRSSTLRISRGRTLLSAGRDGWIAPDDPQQGLFVFQTRVLCRYRWRLEGQAPELSAASNLEQDRWMGYYIQAPPNCQATPAGECDPLQETVELRLTRSVGDGFHEDVDLANHTQIATALRLELEIGADFIAREEVKQRKQHGELRERWREAGAGIWELDFDYHAHHAYDQQGNRGEAQIHRGLRLRIERAGAAPAYASGRINFLVVLPPHGRWHVCLSGLARLERDGQETELPLRARCRADPEPQPRAPEPVLGNAAFLTVPGEGTTGATVVRVLDRSRRDLVALRLLDVGGANGDHSFTVAAGVPTYMALFGRDLLTSGWQALPLSTGFAAGALETLSRYHAVERNDWRDAQPGRLLHEAETDPLSSLNYRPLGLYFGSYTTSVLYPVLLGILWRWTGDRELTGKYLPTAVEALAWADRYSRGKDGFYRYQKRSQQGVKNQGWKDSEDAIVAADGSQVPDPLGTCEMQGYAYAAKMQLSEVLWWLGQEPEARRLYDQATALKQRFNETFWMPDQDCFALGIRENGDLIRSVASDAGHCLVTGIVDERLAPALAERMMRADLFSGWGIRTLSAQHPAFNPFSYHRGSVWPVENGYIAMGLGRYGLRQPLQRLARGVFDAAALFAHGRLPEVFAGHARDAQHPFPGLYTKADWPQAWSASAPFAILHSLLGLQPYAPLQALFVDPWLPDWLPELSLHQLAVGAAKVSLHFRRGDDGHTAWEVTALNGTLHVLPLPRPAPRMAGWAAEEQAEMRSRLARA